MIWLGVILTATSLPGSLLPRTQIPFADKAVHFSMYGVLGFLFARAMHNPPRTTRFRVILAAFLFVAAIGALDEWHQRYMQDRSTEFADWMADSAGGLIGALLWTVTSRPKSPRTA